MQNRHLSPYPEDELVEVIDDAGAAPRERRRHPRRHSKARVEIRKLSRLSRFHSFIPGIVKDISPHGIGMLTRLPFADGQAIEVEFQPKDVPPFRLTGTICTSVSTPLGIRYNIHIPSAPDNFIDLVTERF